MIVSFLDFSSSTEFIQETFPMHERLASEAVRDMAREIVPLVLQEVKGTPSPRSRKLATTTTANVTIVTVRFPGFTNGFLK